MKWVKIKDKLPPIRQKLFVYSKKRGVYIDFATTVDLFSKGPVTHWKTFKKDWVKLPNAPKSKG